MSALARLLRDESGATLAEYALIMAIFSVVAIAGMSAIVSAANGDLSRATGGLRGLEDTPPS